MKKTYVTPIVTASDVVRATECGLLHTTRENSTQWYYPPDCPGGRT
jgi:hypothetical protein